VKTLDLIVAELLRDGQLDACERTVRLAAEMFPVRSVNELAAKSGVSWHRAGKAVKKLAVTGWMKPADRRGHLLPIVAIPEPVQLRLANELRSLYDLAPYRGEFLMKYYLTMRIHSCDFVENAHPEFLINPLTGARLEYDMFYRAACVAYEFNGPQHLGEVIHSTDEQAVKEQLMRDAFKRTLSTQHHISLIEVNASTVTPNELEKLIPPDVPRRPIDPDGMLHKTLVKLATDHANKAARARR
jgi:hypothetical protein